MPGTCRVPAGDRPKRVAELVSSSFVARTCAAESRPIFGRTSHESRPYFVFENRATVTEYGRPSRELREMFGLPSSIPRPTCAKFLKSCVLRASFVPVSDEGARPRLVEPLSDTGTRLARSTHDFKNVAQVGRGTEEGLPNISRSSREGRPQRTADTRGMYARISVDSRPYRDELRASYARAGNELCDLKNRRRLVADVKDTFRVSASFGRLQKIAGDPENSRDARRNIGRTTAVNVV
ncbi:hypothetical protein Bbelb_279010 [Branchiostoma belcheri]|nr:hypothetical protein Bbelb_279010 [Branchiostoma belcheri]